MSSTWGQHLIISLFGESHGPAVGVVIDGLPPGFILDESEIARQMSRRAPGRTPWSTQRMESDEIRILSGLYRQRTSGAPLCALIENKDVRSEDYDELKIKPRPGHADLTAQFRYHGFQDPRGSGHFSGRLTAPLVFAGAVCRQIIKSKGIRIGAHIAEIAGIRDEAFDPLCEDKQKLCRPGERDFPVLNEAAGQDMISEILKAAQAGDSVGGVVEAMICGLPAGLGNPMFGGIESRLSSLLFGVPGIKGVAFGAGFEAARMTGSEHNDVPFFKDGVISYRTNHSGGIIGGISNGMPIVFQTVVRPPASIAKPQQTVNLKNGCEETLVVKGRHDPCIVPRVVPVIEAAAAVFTLDLLLDEGVPAYV